MKKVKAKTFCISSYVNSEINYSENDFDSLASENNGPSGNLRNREKVSPSTPKHNSPINIDSPSTSSRKKKQSYLQSCDSLVSDSEYNSQERKRKTSYKKLRQLKPKTQNNTKIRNVVSNNEDVLSESPNIEHFCDKIACPLGLTKLNYDVSTDPNTIDRLSNDPISDSDQPSTSESPTSKKERVDAIARQCRLHPSNKKYNQGPVENPPPIVPGKLVGFTPAGQRYEVDLNSNRPSWFNSEYARLQFDYATRVNAARMIHQLETGEFLPDNLDPSIERRYFAEKELITKQAKEHFKSLLKGREFSEHDFSNKQRLFSSDDEDENLRLLQTEGQLIEMVEYANLRLKDFPKNLTERLQKALNFKITTLMLKKNPIILTTLEMLVSQRIDIEVSRAASALLDKCKELFDTPENVFFKDYFNSQVAILKEKTNTMSAFDILMMTEEPDTTVKDNMIRLQDTAKEENSQLKPEPGEKTKEKPHLQIESNISEIAEPADEWIPVQDGENWIDATNRDNQGLTMYTDETQNESFDPDSSTTSDSDNLNVEENMFVPPVISEE